MVKLNHTSPRTMGFPRNDRKGNREIAGSSPFPPFYLQFTTRIVWIVCLCVESILETWIKFILWQTVNSSEIIREIFSRSIDNSPSVIDYRAQSIFTFPLKRNNET